jgi:anaerobic ribonucleoside-triphosphate reductase activating protein
MTIDTASGILIHQIVFPLQVLGPGNRVGIWLQGCTIHCNGCISPDTWAFDENNFMSFSELKQMLQIYYDKDPDGVTISGGEPFDQPEGLLSLLMILHDIGFTSIMVYSGYSFEYLKKIFPRHLDLIDILISEPFILEENNTKLWRGSDNQQIHLTSARGRKDLDEQELNESRYSDQRSLQIIQNPDSIFIAGIPKREDLEKIKVCKNQFIEFKKGSD